LTQIPKYLQSIYAWSAETRAEGFFAFRFSFRRFLVDFRRFFGGDKNAKPQSGKTMAAARERGAELAIF